MFNHTIELHQTIRDGIITALEEITIHIPVGTALEIPGNKY